jgi:pimeloyl-ACP methyl ester carboxylesterase
MDSIRREAANTMHEARRTAPQAFFMEAETPRQLAQLALQYPRLLKEPRGDGHPVLFLPGFTAADTSTRSLRRYVKLLGYDARGWGLGRNTGDVALHAPQVIEIVKELNAATGRAVSLVGWSMGGVIAREVALHQPDKVRRVITMGSPITGGPKYTAFADQLASGGVDLDAVEAHIHRRQRTSPPLRVPVTAIFSRQDGVVAWQACIDQINESVEHVEVSSSHLGLGFDPEVYRLIARRLATE